MRNLSAGWQTPQPWQSTSSPWAYPVLPDSAPTVTSLPEGSSSTGGTVAIGFELAFCLVWLVLAVFQNTRNGSQRGCDTVRQSLAAGRFQTLFLYCCSSLVRQVQTLYPCSAALLDYRKCLAIFSVIGSTDIAQRLYSSAPARKRTCGSVERPLSTFRHSERRSLPSSCPAACGHEPYDCRTVVLGQLLAAAVQNHIVPGARYQQPCNATKGVKGMDMAVQPVLGFHVVAGFCIGVVAAGQNRIGRAHV